MAILPNGTWAFFSKNGQNQGDYSKMEEVLTHTALGWKPGDSMPTGSAYNSSVSGSSAYWR